MIVSQDCRLISFSGQDKHFDEALDKAQQKANEWLAASAVELISISPTSLVAPSGKYICGLTIAYRSNPFGIDPELEAD
jgi:hypothetical protein